MTHKMEENITNPFEGGLSMFGMNFASKGLCWAGNIYQKWENICQNNIMVQESSKLVDAVGEQVRKIYEEVTDDLLNPLSLGRVKVPVSGLPLELDIIPDVSEKSTTCHEEGPINEGLLISHMSTLSISSEEVSLSPLPDIRQDEGRETCDMLNKKIAFTPAEDNRCSFSSDIQDNHEEASNSTFNNHSSSLSSPTGVSLSKFPENMVEREFMLSRFTDPTKEDGNAKSEEVISFVQTSSTVPEQRSSLSEPEVPLLIMDIGSSDSFSEQNPKYSVTDDKKSETNEEFEDVSLEDFFEEKKHEDSWEEDESYELALISYRAMKNRSYKKKLKDAFTSRFNSPKKNGYQKTSFFGVSNTDLLKRGITVSSSVSRRVSEASNVLNLESYESEWELI